MTEATTEALMAEFLRGCATVAEVRFALLLLESSSVHELYGNGAIRLELSYKEECVVLCELRAQVELLEGTRTDFVIYQDGREVLAIEIDDASHWRDEGKALRDRQRDLSMLAYREVQTVRFTNAQAISGGREIVTAIGQIVMNHEMTREYLWAGGWQAHKAKLEKESAEEVIWLPAPEGETIQ